MNKKNFGSKTMLYPMPTTLIGANVNGKPNYLVAAWVGIVGCDPALISVTLGSNHYTNIGIRETKTFSVNLPSAKLMEKVDYCGVVSGNRTDKSTVFNSFYGKLQTAPMVEDCPVNLECRLVQTLSFDGDDEVFIGEIVETYVDQTCLTDGLPDMTKMDLMIYSTQDRNYWKTGEHLGKAYRVGLNYKPLK